MRRRRTYIGVVALLAGAVALASPARLSLPIPFGWSAIGDSSYTIGADTGLRIGGRGFAVATIQSTQLRPIRTGILQQSILADDYRGARVRLTGFLKADAPDADAMLWMRVDGATEVRTSDYMEDRPVRGVTEWTEYAIVLDVPRDAVGITFGFALVGSGRIWLDDASLEIVGRDIPTTGHSNGVRGVPTPLTRTQSVYRGARRRPINLDFEERLIAVR